MFFGPSNVNLTAADSACFLTRNLCANAIEKLVKTKPECLLFFFNQRPFNLQVWTDTTQACCLTWLFRSLSMSSIRGKDKLMEKFSNNVRNSAPQVFPLMLNCYSYTSEEFIKFISEYDRETHVQYGMNVLLSAEWVRSEISGTRRKPAEQLDDYNGEEMDMMKGVMEYLLTPLFNYWK